MISDLLSDVLVRNVFVREFILQFICCMCEFSYCVYNMKSIDHFVVQQLGRCCLVMWPTMWFRMWEWFGISWRYWSSGRCRGSFWPRQPTRLFSTLVDAGRPLKCYFFVIGFTLFYCHTLCIFHSLLVLLFVNKKKEENSFRKMRRVTFKGCFLSCTGTITDCVLYWRTLATIVWCLQMSFSSIPTAPETRVSLRTNGKRGESWVLTNLSSITLSFMHCVLWEKSINRL